LLRCWKMLLNCCVGAVTAATAIGPMSCNPGTSMFDC